MAELICPGCGKSNHESAMLCDRCGRDLLAEADTGLAAPDLEPGAENGSDDGDSPAPQPPRSVCLEPGCGYEFTEEDEECRRCGAPRPTGEDAGWRITGDGIMIEISAGERVTLGRAGLYADQFASRDNVSGTHLLISVTESGETATILDLQSTNGTYVNGDPIEPGRDVEVHEPVSLRLASNVNLRLERA